MPFEETEYPLDYGVNAAPFNAFGEATLTIGPSTIASNAMSPPIVAGELWTVRRYVTFCSGFGCTLVMYKNTIGDANVIDSTADAQGDVGGIEIPLLFGESIIFAWGHGTLGDVVSCHIYGSRRVRGFRSYATDRRRWL